MKGSLIGGISGFALGAYLDHENQREVPQDVNAFLHKVVTCVSLHPENLRYRKLLARANWLSDQLQRYGSKLATPPTQGGSTCDGTALKNSFDIDINLSFAQKSFPSTRAMFEDLLAFLDQLEGRLGIVDIRDQKKSISVFINIGEKSHKIDVVRKSGVDQAKRQLPGICLSILRYFSVMPLLIPRQILKNCEVCA